MHSPTDNRSSNVAEQVARSYFRSPAGPAAHDVMARRFLHAAILVPFMMPALFYLRFRSVGQWGWGFTIFLTALCLLNSIGFYFLDRKEYHTTVEASGGILDKIGGLWLLACAFGPLAGLAVTASIFPLTESNWWWRYCLRVVFSMGLPLVTAFPLLRYCRGKAALIAVPVLLGVTALPLWSGVNTFKDLRGGVEYRMETYNEFTKKQVLLTRIRRIGHLSHTDRSFIAEDQSQGSPGTPKS